MILKLKTPDIKFPIEQSHSIFYLSYHAFATHKFQVLGWDILANKLKS
jgi:hypothetical protein